MKNAKVLPSESFPIYGILFCSVYNNDYIICNNLQLSQYWSHGLLVAVYACVYTVMLIVRVLVSLLITTECFIGTISYNSENNNIVMCRQLSWLKHALYISDCSIRVYYVMVHNTYTYSLNFWCYVIPIVTQLQKFNLHAK